MAPMARSTPRPAWRLTAGLGAGMVLLFALLRWLPALRRKSKIDLIRERAEALTARIAEFTDEAAARTGDAWGELKDRATA